MAVVDALIAATLPLVPKPIVRRIASRYVAGEAREEAIGAVRALNERGLEVTLALLGEEVHRAERASAAVEEYVQVLDLIEREQLRANVSIKLTLLGLEIDEAMCEENLERVVQAAKAHGNFVRIDMEDHTCTDATLRMYRDAQERHGNVGTVLQAYLRRTLNDIANELPEQGASIRICKGIYVEPEKVAFQRFARIREKFLEALDALIDRDVYVAIATHDEYLIDESLRRIEDRALARDRYEFQVLLGVAEKRRTELVDAGHTVRVYVPYGADWYAYSVRRLRENPKIAWYVTKAMFSR